MNFATQESARHIAYSLPEVQNNLSLYYRNQINEYKLPQHTMNFTALWNSRINEFPNLAVGLHSMFFPKEELAAARKGKRAL